MDAARQWDESSGRPDEYLIQGKPVRLPVVVRDASVGMATFAVPSRSVRRLIPDHQLVPVEVWPGKALCSLGMIDYRDNDLGDYNEVSVLFFVRPAAERPPLPYIGSVLDLVRGRLGTYIHRLPVNQSFTCEAGRAIWGFPKTVEEIDIQYDSDVARCVLRMDGVDVFALELARGGTMNLADAEQTSFTYIDGALHRTSHVQSGRGARFALGSRCELSLGRHALSDELRSLGLPKRPLVTMWIENMSATFGAAERLA